MRTFYQGYDINVYILEATKEALVSTPAGRHDLEHQRGLDE